MIGGALYMTTLLFVLDADCGMLCGKRRAAALKQRACWRRAGARTTAWWTAPRSRTFPTHGRRCWRSRAAYCFTSADPPPPAAPLRLLCRGSLRRELLLKEPRCLLLCFQKAADLQACSRVKPRQASAVPAAPCACVLELPGPVLWKLQCKLAVCLAVLTA